MLTRAEGQKPQKVVLIKFLTKWSLAFNAAVLKTQTNMPVVTTVPCPTQ